MLQSSALVEGKKAVLPSKEIEEGHWIKKIRFDIFSKVPGRS